MASRNTKKTSSNGNYKRGQSNPQWTDLPNNLDLRSYPQSSKKQRNKDGLIDKSKSTYQNMHGSNSNQHFSANHSSSNKLSLAAWQSEQQLVTDSEHEDVNQQNIFRHGQNSHYQNSQHLDERERHLMESHASKLYKEDNTKKTPDTSIVVERLMHLRDCIKQVSSIMSNLEKTDEPVTRDQMKRLNNMLRQLQQEEQQHFDLLQQMLTTNEEASASSNSAEGIYMASNNDVESNSKEQNGELEETIEHGQRLMRKMIESQEKMESLKKQQAELLSMQKHAEDKLAEAKSFHATLMKKEAVAKNQLGRYNYPLEWKNKESDQSSNNNEDRTNENSDIQSLWPLRRNSAENSVSDGNQVVNWSGDMPQTGLEVTFENLKQRLEHLKDLAYNKTAEETNERIPEIKDSKSELHRKKLENKLKEIQAKKKHMDKMLVELSALEQASINVKNSQSNSTQFVTADSTIQEAQHLLDTIDAREKVKKLEEMKESLSQLRAMVNSIQPMSGDVSSVNNEDQVETISNSSKSSSQAVKSRSDPKLHQNSQQISHVKKDNIKQDHSNKFPVRRHYEAEGRANEDGDNAALAASVQDGSSGSDESWENDPQVQEKVRKLQETKQKLQKLQDLMSAVQNSKDCGGPATIEYLQLLSAISDDERQDLAENKSQLNSNGLNEYDDEIAETQNQRDLIRLEAVEEKMQQQQQELEKLMEERRRLLHMQTQLTKLQHQFPNSSSLSDERISLQQKTSKKICGNSLNSKSLSPCRQGRSDNCTLGRQNLSYEQPNTNMKSRSDNKKTVSKKENINSMSANLSGRIKDGKDDLLNSDVNDNVTMESLIAQTSELDNSLTLQEIKQNVLLEDILRQNHKHQGYSNNEDVRSRSGSSANSEFQEESNSILAPDTTAAATWGGSSTQNDFEDEQVESLEEQDGDGINRWNVKKNFHQEQQRNHISTSHNQEASIQ
ncbi:putative leucine-rich repeat-containing protein DDB_G0290503 isoform X2 [Centruroides vittatus]|uniref:putative leucine-rich repeat-containing protein DDB_G0290503 isoform X2 n=1 Tax=Centruroides vittatus TaxID=120091 RepID=UPI00350FC5A8